MPDPLLRLAWCSRSDSGRTTCSLMAALVSTIPHWWREFKTLEDILILVGLLKRQRKCQFDDRREFRLKLQTEQVNDMLCIMFTRRFKAARDWRRGRTIRGI